MDISPSVIGVNMDGSALGGGRAAAKKASLADMELGLLTGNRDYIRPDVVVRLNNSAIEERIRNDGHKWRRGLFDPAARAHYMGKGLRCGLLQSINDAELKQPGQWAVFGRNYVFWMGAEMLFGTRGLGVLLAAWRDGLLANAVMSLLEKKQYGVGLREKKWSSFAHIHFDRLAVANGLARATRLIKALNGSDSIEATADSAPES